mmetsp:Transcript_128094/g.180727  ORF Transcript_128094/g.180727 Transcript_128094/m.180727 type:complete len:102 (-) Transcript_128094:8-313(-)
MSEVEETFNRIKGHKNVQGIVICTYSGKIVRTTYEVKEEGENYAKLIPPLCTLAKKTIKDLDKANNLTFLRLKAKNLEIMVAPDEEYMLIVVQGKKEEEQP